MLRYESGDGDEVIHELGIGLVSVEERGWEGLERCKQNEEGRMSVWSLGACC